MCSVCKLTLGNVEKRLDFLFYKKYLLKIISVYGSFLFVSMYVYHMGTVPMEVRKGCQIP